MESGNQLTILGLSEFALSMIFEIIHHSYDTSPFIQIVRNLPYTSKLPFATSHSNYSVILDQEADYTKIHNCVLGGFGVNTKKILFEYFKNNYNIDKQKYINLIYPNAVLASTVHLGIGIHINPYVVIAPQTQIGNFVSINRNASIGHHTQIGDFCTLNPASNIAGNCQIKSGVTLGMGANIIDGISIGKNTTIGAGSLVTKDLPANVVAYGVPAKIIRSLNTVKE